MHGQTYIKYYSGKNRSGREKHKHREYV